MVFIWLVSLFYNEYSRLRVPVVVCQSDYIHSGFQFPVPGFDSVITGMGYIPLPGVDYAAGGIRDLQANRCGTFRVKRYMGLTGRGIGVQGEPAWF